MIQLARVFQRSSPGAPCVAEVPGQPGRFVEGPDLSMLRRSLRTAIDEADRSGPAIAPAPAIDPGANTELYLRV